MPDWSCHQCGGVVFALSPLRRVLPNRSSTELIFGELQECLRCGLRTIWDAGQETRILSEWLTEQENKKPPLTRGLKRRRMGSKVDVMMLEGTRNTKPSKG